jgi:hypothetical protein
MSRANRGIFVPGGNKGANRDRKGDFEERQLFEGGFFMETFFLLFGAVGWWVKLKPRG